MSNDWFEESKASASTADVAAALGMIVRRNRFGPCPVCNEDVKGRGIVRVKGPVWLCSRCPAKGNTPQLVAILLHGTPKPASWSQVRAWFASRGWCSGDGTDAPRWTPPPPRPAPEPEPYPDEGELARFLSLGGAVEHDREVAAFWHARGFGARTGAAWALPAVHRPGWPEWWGCGYRRTWRLACPMVDATGTIRSVHARAVVDDEGRGKTRSPKERRLDSLLFADPWIAVPMLRGERVACDVLVAEGITDYCALTSIALPGVAILGGISGSFRALAEVRLPPGCVVFVGTDNDAAGDKYAAEVVAAVGERAECRRVVWGVGGQDASDIVRAGVDVRERLALAVTL